MTPPDTSPDEEQQPLRLDIRLNLEPPAGHHSGVLDWLAQFARSQKELESSRSLVDLACQVYESRRLRNRYLNHSLLGEPVWDMLLALYCFSGRGEVLSVSGLCHSAHVPQTTALRWLQVMEQKKLVHRTRDAKDGRRTYVSLTDEAKAMLEEYLTLLHNEEGARSG